jgi:transposase-like protein
MVKLTQAVFDACLPRLQAGEAATKLASENDVNHATLSRWFRKWKDANPQDQNQTQTAEPDASSTVATASPPPAPPISSSLPPIAPLGESEAESTIDQATQVVREAAENTWGKLEDAVGKHLQMPTKACTLEQWCNWHVAANSIFGYMEHWMWSEELATAGELIWEMEMSRQAREKDLGRVLTKKEEKEFQFPYDTCLQLDWARGHYECWKNIYPDALKWLNISGIYQPIAFAWMTAQIVYRKYESKERILQRLKLKKSGRREMTQEEKEAVAAGLSEQINMKIRADQVVPIT